MNYAELDIDWDLVNDLNERAEYFDMVVDWETLTLTPKVKPKNDYWKEINELKDNDPASPEQAWA